MIYITRKILWILIISFICIELVTLFSKTNVLHTFSNSLAGTTIVIDPGHGHPDAGASSSNNIQEKNINLKIALKLKKNLESAGAKVILTRKDDNSLSRSKTNNKKDDLNKRVEIRDKSNASLFISIHMNYYENSKYSGAQVFYSNSNKENKILAESIQSKLISDADPLNKRKIKNDNNIYVLKGSRIPAVLVECGFLSNVNEANKLNTKKYQKKVADAIFKGIIEYLNK